MNPGNGHRVWRPRLGVVLLTPLLLTGCQNPPKGQYIDAAAVRARDDVYAIRQFWPQFPWLRGGAQGFNGFHVTTYFVSSETERGAYVTGDILAVIYEVTRRVEGGEQRHLLHEWKLDEKEAMGYRVRKRALPGYPYMLALFWPADLDVAGKTVEIEFGYQRGDGRLIASPPRRFRVPADPSQHRSTVTERSRPAGRSDTAPAEPRPDPESASATPGHR